MSKNIKGAIPKWRFLEFRDSGEWEEKELNESLDYLQPTQYLVQSENYSNNYETPVLTAGKSFVLGYTNEKDGIFNNKLPVIIFDDFTTDSKFVDFPFKVKSSAIKILLAKYNFNIKFIFEIMQMVSYEVSVHKRHWISIFSKLKVLIPKLPEQQKIADCLSSIDDLISVEEKKLSLLNDYKKGWMQRLFPAEEKTVPEWRFPEFQDNKEWETAKLINIADYRRGSFPQPYGLAKWYDEFNGMPFIQVFDVDDNMRLKATTKNKISKLASKQSVFIGKGTLIVTLQGSIGRVAITQYDAYIDRTLLLFEKFYMDIDKVFFAYIIQRLFEIKKQSAPGGIIKTITKQALSEFTVKLPERPEQEKIAKFLSGIDDLIITQTDRIEALKQYKKALMQGLFPVTEEV